MDNNEKDTSTDYFDRTEKMLQNLINCTEHDLDEIVIKSCIVNLTKIIKSQNTLLENFVTEQGVKSIKNKSNILVGMICFIKNQNCFGSIVDVDDVNEIYTIKILNTGQLAKIDSKEKFEFL